MTGTNEFVYQKVLLKSGFRLIVGPVPTGQFPGMSAGTSIGALKRAAKKSSFSLYIAF